MSYGKNRKENKAKGISNFDDNGVFAFFVAGLLMTLISGLITIDSNEENKRKVEQSDSARIVREEQYNLDLKNALAERDSIHEFKDSLLTVAYSNKVDSSNALNISTTIKALGEFNLVLIDSLNKVVPKINSKSFILPQLMIAHSSPYGTPSIYTNKKSDGSYINIKLITENNIAYNIKVNLYTFIRIPINDTKEAINLISYKNFADVGMLSLGTTNTITLKGDENWFSLTDAVIFLLGTYTSDEPGKNIINYSQGYLFNFVENKLERQLSKSELKSYLEYIRINIK